MRMAMCLVMLLGSLTAGCYSHTSCTKWGKNWDKPDYSRDRSGNTKGNYECLRRACDDGYYSPSSAVDFPSDCTKCDGGREAQRHPTCR
jgi:hypothetical protein